MKIQMTAVLHYFDIVSKKSKFNNSIFKDETRTSDMFQVPTRLKLKFIFTSNYEEQCYDGDLELLYTEGESMPYSLKHSYDDDCQIQGDDMRITIKLIEKLQHIDLFDLSNLDGLIIELEV